MEKHKKNFEVEGFTIINDITLPCQNQKIGRVLPHWLLHPVPVSRNLKDIRSPKEACPLLHPKLVDKLKRDKICQLFPVQQTVIPYVLIGASGMERRFRPRDVCVATPTGSGKTLSFVLPIVQALSGRTVPALRALVILPVVELAKQVYDVFCTYASLFGLKVGQALGLERFSSEQSQLVRRVYGRFLSEVDILVATPGRLVDHITKTPGLEFTQLRFFVLDEADKLLSGAAGEMISRIQRHVMTFKQDEPNLGLPPFFPPPRHDGASNPQGNASREGAAESRDLAGFFAQSFEREVIRLDEEAEATNRNFLAVPTLPVQRLLFSATLSHDPEQLQNVALYMPILFTTESDECEEGKQEAGSVGEFVRPLELREEAARTEVDVKPLALHYLLRKERRRDPAFRSLVFASSLELTSKLAVLLRALSGGKYSVEEFSSRFKRERKDKISRFLDGSINVLVSTDAMARGIDVPNIDCIISYDVVSSNTYIHRIGRTARAGRPGKAVSLVTAEELKHLKRCIGSKFFGNVTQRTIDEEKLKKFEASFESALETLSKALSSREKTGHKIPKTLKRKNFFKEKFKQSRK